MYHNVHCSTITIARTQNQPKCPSIAEWIKKMWQIYTMEYYSAIKGNETELFVVRWMALESVIQSEVSQKEKSKYHMLTHIQRILKKIGTDGHSFRAGIKRQTQRMDLRIWGGRGKPGRRESSIDIYTLPNVKQLAGGKQQCSTGRSARCFVTTQRGGIGKVGGRRKREEIWGYMFMCS